MNDASKRLPHRDIASGRTRDSSSRSFTRPGLALPLVGMALLGIIGSIAWLVDKRATPAQRIELSKGAVDAADAAVTPNVLKPMAPKDAFAENMARPIDAEAIEPQRPFVLPNDTNKLSEARATECLTSAIYYEAASEGPQGQKAVAQVVLNRVRSPFYPHSVCGVVYQGSSLQTGCQFTFTCDGSLVRTPPRAGWKRAQEIAFGALHGTVEPSVGTATHYHTLFVVPYWAASLQKISVIGNHIFYRLPGPMGARAAFKSDYTGEDLEIEQTPLDAAAALVEQVQSQDASVTYSDPLTAFGRPLVDQNGGHLTTPSELGKLRADNERGQLKTDSAERSPLDARASPAP